MKATLLIIGAAIVFMLYGMAMVAPQNLLEPSKLKVQPVSPKIHSVLVYEQQGGNRQTIQVTMRAHQLQPSYGELQADPESTDIQPALGYKALSWQLQPTSK